MIWKLALIIVSGAVIAACLLAVRQQRIQAVHDMTRALERAAQADEELWRVRVEIARHVSPDSMHAHVKRIGPTKPILVDWRQSPEPPRPIAEVASR